MNRGAPEIRKSQLCQNINEITATAAEAEAPIAAYMDEVQSA